MKTSEKITTFLALASAVALQAGPASAGTPPIYMDGVMYQLPGPDALSLVALGVVAAVYVARRLK